MKKHYTLNELKFLNETIEGKYTDNKPAALTRFFLNPIFSIKPHFNKIKKPSGDGFFYM